MSEIPKLQAKKGKRTLGGNHPLNQKAAELKAERKEINRVLRNVTDAQNRQDAKRGTLLEDTEDSLISDTLDATDILWKPQEGPQTEFLKCTEDEVLFSGGRGSGKSDCLIVDPLRYCANKNFRGLVIRRTMPELRELISRAKQIYPAAYPKTKWKEMEKMFIFPSGARMEFGFCDSEDDLERYRGQEYTWLGIDEITQFPNSNILEKLKASLRSTDPSLPIHIRATTNPTGAGRGWVKDRWTNLAPPGVRIIIPPKDMSKVQEYLQSAGFESDAISKMSVTRKWFNSTVKDNPILLKSNPQYVATLASLENESLRKQWLEGDWDSAEGVAFSEFNEAVHVVRPFEIPGNWYKFRACDWGYGSMAVCLWLAVDFNNNVYVYREYTATGVNAEDFGNKVLDLEMYERISKGVLDGSCFAQRGEIGETPGDTMMRLGLRWIPADRSKGSRASSKVLVHKYLQRDIETGEPKLKIFNNCPELIRELGTLMLDDTLEDVDTSKKSKLPDHAYDALRYGLMASPSIYETRSDVFTSFKSTQAPMSVNSTIGM